MRPIAITSPELGRSSIVVRPACEDDAHALATLSGELGYPIDSDTMRERIRAVLATGSDLLIVAVDQRDTPVGWLQAHCACLVESGFRAEIVGLIVSSYLRRSGVGRRLVEEAGRWATGLGAKFMEVRSNSQRIESHLFYPALGFKPSKTQHVYRKALSQSASPS